MIRIIDGLKYDTDKMELIAKYTYGSFSICFGICNKTCEIYKSKKRKIFADREWNLVTNFGGLCEEKTDVS